MTEDERRELASALIPVVLEAGRVELSYFRNDIEIGSKSDNSPVTAADQEAEEIITRALSKICPNIPVVGEEAAAAGAAPAIRDRFFLVDPLDGTRDFISGGEDFTVNIALIEQSQPVFGVVYQPPTGRLFISVASNIAHEAKVCAASGARSLDEISSSPIEAHYADEIEQSEISVAISRSHPSPTLEKQLNAQGLTKKVQVGSSLKFCLVARGEADIYPRLTSISEWDTAAGHAILTAAGGAVLDLQGAALAYGNHENGYRISPFVAWSDPLLATRYSFTSD